MRGKALSCKFLGEIKNFDVVSSRSHDGYEPILEIINFDNTLFYFAYCSFKLWRAAL